MRHVLLLVPTHHGVGLTSISLGLLRALDRSGMKVGFCKPIEQLRPGDPGPERSTALVRLTTDRDPPEPIGRHEAEKLIAMGDEQVLMERVVEVFHQVGEDAEVVVVEGLVPSTEMAFADKVNESLALTLDAEVIIVGCPTDEGVDEMVEHMAIVARGYGGGRLRGVVVNRVKVSAPEGTTATYTLGESPKPDPVAWGRALSPIRGALARERLHLIGCVPEHPELARPRVFDLARQLEARVLIEGEWKSRRIRRTRLCARTVPHVLGALKTGNLVITPGDREDIVLAVSVAALSGERLAGLLLTGGFEPVPGIWQLCQPAFETGLTVMVVDADSYDTANQVHGMDREVPVDDKERAELVMNTVAGYLDVEDFKDGARVKTVGRMSPPAFRHKLIELARAAKKRIVLPEGDEPRTLEAAATCAERGIATCILLGDPEKIAESCRQAGVKLPAQGIEIVDAVSAIDRYVEPMVELRKHKGLNQTMAREQLADTVVLGTMMLKLDEVDGLVSGAVHTTANTIRPALQLIKTAPGSSIVSSVFFMCLPESVVVYGDCAVNPDPNAEELAEIAMQSADSAAAFGIPPRVAMISYSTGASGSGDDVEKVREAVEIARKRRMELCIDGPLQYDAAAIASVAKSKAPDSPVAGQATVFVFPDLNTGNTTYKAVQRSAGVVSIGPMLQGLAKPVNDLSRGALVEDIVYTIALTAIQASTA